MVKMLQSDAQFCAPLGASPELHQEAAGVVSLVLTALGSLVAADELDFFAAFSILTAPPAAASAASPASPRIAYFVLTAGALLDCSAADHGARVVVTQAMLRFIAAGAEQIGQWAEEELLGRAASDDDGPTTLLSSDGLRITTEGGWEGGAWAGIGVSATATSMSSSPPTASLTSTGPFSPAKALALKKAVALLWRIALARNVLGCGGTQCDDGLAVPEAVRTAALRSLAALPLGAVGLLPAPISLDDEVVDTEGGVVRLLHLIEHEGSRRAACSSASHDDDNSQALIHLLARAALAEVVQRGKWATLRSTAADGGDSSDGGDRENGDAEWSSVLLRLQLPANCAFGAILGKLREGSAMVKDEYAWRTRAILHALSLLPRGTLPQLLGPLLRSSAVALLRYAAHRHYCIATRRQFYCTVARLATSHGPRCQL